MLKNAFLIIFTLALLFQSCKKYSGPTIAQGQVIDATTGKGVPFAEIIVVSEKRSSATAMSRSQTENATADANGKFSFTIETNDDYYYRLDAEANHYYSDAEGGSIRNSEKNENMTVKIKPKGYIKFNLVENHEENREITIFGDYNPHIYVNQEASSVFRHVFGNMETNITIRYRASDGDYYEHIKFYVPALDTVEYTIKY